MKKQSRFRKITKSKKTTFITLTILLLPFIVLGAILLRDSMQTGKPVIGDRTKDQFKVEITEDNLKTIDGNLVDELIVKKKVTLKSSTLRVYIEVNDSLSKNEIKKLAEDTYNQVVEVLPIEDYFKASETHKQYDLEVHVYNDVLDRESDEFIYLEVMHNSTMEEAVYTFVTDAKDPEFKEEVLENMEKADEEDEEDSGGE